MPDFVDSLWKDLFFLRSGWEGYRMEVGEKMGEEEGRETVTSI